MKTNQLSDIGVPVSYGDWDGRPPAHVRNAVDDPQQKRARQSRLDALTESTP